MIKVSLKVENLEDDFAEYESEVREWDDVEAFVAITRRQIEKAQAQAEAVIPEESEE